MKDLREQLEEDKHIRNLCSKCGLCSGDKKVIECNLGNPRTSLEDYQTEYRFWDKAIPNESSIVEYSERGPKIIKFSEHKHSEALTIALPLENGFIMKKKICSTCRNTYETSIYQDAFEHVRLTEKLKRRA